MIRTATLNLDRLCKYSASKIKTPTALRAYLGVPVKVPVVALNIKTNIE